MTRSNTSNRSTKALTSKNNFNLMNYIFAYKYLSIYTHSKLTTNFTNHKYLSYFYSSLAFTLLILLVQYLEMTLYYCSVNKIHLLTTSRRCLFSSAAAILSLSLSCLLTIRKHSLKVSNSCMHNIN
jgi:hypothetical protein